jgi:hypothetical protein
MKRMLAKREAKSLFSSFSSEKDQNLLFLKKKKQKDFYSRRSFAWRGITEDSV